MTNEHPLTTATWFHLMLLVKLSIALLLGGAILIWLDRFHTYQSGLAWLVVFSSP